MEQNPDHALVIGIADYQHIRPLPADVLNDARDIRDVLVSPLYCAYPEQNVTLLLDGEATRAAIEEAFQNLAAQVGKGSRIFIFYSGHGGLIPQGEYAGAYLLPVDTRYESSASLAESAISGDEFTSWIKQLPARQVLVAFDSCHAGGVGDPKSIGESAAFKAGLSDQYYEKVMRTGIGRVILASSRESEYSWVTAGDSNSLFTKHLLGGLRGGAARDDGYVRVFHLYEYLQPRVTAEKAIQHPIFKCTIEENFPLAYNTVYKGIALPAALADGYEYDVYISCLESGDDTDWVEFELAPRLEQEGIRFGVSCDSNNPGLPRITKMQRAMQIARRTLVMLSDEYLQSNLAEFENSMAQYDSVQAGQWRVIPVRRSKLASTVPLRLEMLAGVDLSDERRASRRLDALIDTLKKPAPTM
jgi:hypothetical protein